MNREYSRKNHPEFKRGVVEMYKEMGGKVITNTKELTPYEKGVRCPGNNSCTKVNTEDCSPECNIINSIAKRAQYLDFYD